MQSLLKYGLVYLILTMTSGAASAANDSLEYYRDSSSQMPYQDILNNHLNWQRIARNKANFGFTTDTIWLRFPISNASSSEVVKHLRINYPLLDHVDAYLVHEGQTLEHKYLSDLIPYSEDRQHDKYYLFNYTLPAETHYWIYLRIETHYWIYLRIEL